MILLVIRLKALMNPVSKCAFSRVDCGRQTYFLEIDIITDIRSLLLFLLFMIKIIHLNAKLYKLNEKDITLDDFVADSYHKVLQ